MNSPLKKLAGSLREYALSFPGAHEDMPWGERVAKVNKKVFVFLGILEPGGAPIRFSVKLPQSSGWALSMPFTEPTGYGLGKSGWVTVTVRSGKQPPLELLRSWIEESYRAVAPRKMAALLDAPAAPAAPSRPARSKPRPARRKPARR